MSLPYLPREASTILFVDDEAQACKWFARTFAEEFTIRTAENVEAALTQLNAYSDEIAVLMTDYRMPGRTGLELLKIMRRDFKSVLCILTTGYAATDVAIEAVNEGQVFKILEKPMDYQQTKLALREALAVHSARARERALHENRAQATRETLAFLAHELNTPLTVVRGYMTALEDWYQKPLSDTETSPLVCFSEPRPGAVLAAIQVSERSALYCQSLVSTFVQSARDAYPGGVAQSVPASGLVSTLLEEYPFEGNERSWISCTVMADFFLPGQRDLFYLVLCTLTKNALFALQGTENPSLQIMVGYDPQPDETRLHWIRFVDNGPGIQPEVLAKLTREPITTHAESGGNGMGLIFCRRLMLSLGGAIEIASEPGNGATVTLRFQPL